MVSGQMSGAESMKRSAIIDWRIRFDGVDGLLLLLFLMFYVLIFHQVPLWSGAFIMGRLLSQFWLKLPDASKEDLARSWHVAEEKEAVLLLLLLPGFAVVMLLFLLVIRGAVRGCRGCSTEALQQGCADRSNKLCDSIKRFYKLESSIEGFVNSFLENYNFFSTIEMENTLFILQREQKTCLLLLLASGFVLGPLLFVIYINDLDVNIG
eukprot:g43535.t1